MLRQLALSIYPRLPAPLKHLACSLEGYRLQRQRFVGESVGIRPVLTPVVHPGQRGQDLCEAFVVVMRHAALQRGAFFKQALCAVVVAESVVDAAQRMQQPRPNAR